VSGGRAFQKLGKYSFSSGTVKVVLSAAGADGTVVADAVGEADARDSGGGGISTGGPQTAQQQRGVTQSTTQRTTPDAAFDADPLTGVAVYDSSNGGATNPWYRVGGTSLSTPCWAGLIAIANQARASRRLSPLDGPTQTLPTLYALPASDFHDVTQGYNGYPA